MENKLFNAHKFGAYLRKERTEKGYKSARAFSKAIEERTGVYIDKDTILLIERGERLPDAEKYLALLATLTPAANPMMLDDFVMRSFDAIDGRFALEACELDIKELEISVEKYSDMLMHSTACEPALFSSLLPVLKGESKLPSIYKTQIKEIKASSQIDRDKQADLLRRVEECETSLLSLKSQFAAFIQGSTQEEPGKTMADRFGRRRNYFWATEDLTKPTL